MLIAAKGISLFTGQSTSFTPSHPLWIGIIDNLTSGWFGLRSGARRTGPRMGRNGVPSEVCALVIKLDERVIGGSLEHRRGEALMGAGVVSPRQVVPGGVPGVAVGVGGINQRTWAGGG